MRRDGLIRTAGVLWALFCVGAQALSPPAILTIEQTVINDAYPASGGSVDVTVVITESETGPLQDLAFSQQIPAMIALEGSQGGVYMLGPDRVFDKPQRVWLPVPEGVDPGQLDVRYYFRGDEGSGAWYPADKVDGWMVPETFLQVELNGTTYFGFVVRHAGIVQLGPVQKPEASSNQVAAVFSKTFCQNTSGDIALFLGVALVLGFVRARRIKPSESR